jgi:2-dehydropantoate 2-reductase
MGSKAHILGAGGIGIAVAESLIHAGWQVTLVESNPAKLEAARRDGMTLQGRPTRRPEVQDFAEWQPPADAPVLLCTKTFDNPAVLERLRSVQRLVPVQNGYDPLLERKPPHLGNHPT